MPERRTLNRTYSVGDQVPTCPVFPRAKIQSSFGILVNFPSQFVFFYVKEIKNIPITKEQSCYMWNKCDHKTQGGCPACKWNESTDPGDENCHRSSYWKLSKNPNTRVATSQERQAKPYRKSSGALTSEVTSVTGPLQAYPKGKLKPLPTDWQKHGTKQEKNRSSSRTRTTLRKDRFEPMETEASICQIGKIQMNTKMKNQEAHSKYPQEQSHLYESNTGMLRDQQNLYKEPIV